MQNARPQPQSQHQGVQICQPGLLLLLLSLFKSNSTFNQSIIYFLSCLIFSNSRDLGLKTEIYKLLCFGNSD